MARHTPQPAVAPSDAGPWPRLGAWAVDSSLFTLVDVVFLGLAAWLNALGRPAWVLAAGFVASKLLWYVYVFEFTRRCGQTPGKRLAAVQVVAPDGAPPDARRMGRRVLVEFLFDMAGPLGMALGWVVARACSLQDQLAGGAVMGGLTLGTLINLVNPLWVIRSPRRQALHDLAAGTFVLRVAPGRGPRLGWIAVAATVLSQLAVVGPVRKYLVQAYVVPSGSMEPTIEIGDRLLANNLVHRLRPPRRREIIMFQAPEWASPRPATFVKRVVGIPGDHLRVSGGKLLVNGEPQDEPYLLSPPAYTWPPGGGEVTVPPGRVVVLGDNRNNSADSHLWERISPDGRGVEPMPFLPLQNLRGNLVFRFWPPDRFGMVAQR